MDAKGKNNSASMIGARYNQFVKTWFLKWKRTCYRSFPKGEKVTLIKDHERFLRRGHASDYSNLQAERDPGFETVQQHPKVSPDFDAIEGWWHVLQQRLSLTAPVELERRSAFLRRLRRTVTWLSRHAREHGKKLCTNQKDRARAVKKLDGARCKW